MSAVQDESGGKCPTPGEKGGERSIGIIAREDVLGEYVRGNAGTHMGGLALVLCCLRRSDRHTSRSDV